MTFSSLSAPREGGSGGKPVALRHSLGPSPIEAAGPNQAIKMTVHSSQPAHGSSSDCCRYNTLQRQTVAARRHGIAPPCGLAHFRSPEGVVCRLRQAPLTFEVSLTR